MKSLIKKLALIVAIVMVNQAQAGLLDAVGNVVSDAANVATNVVRDTTQGAANVVRDVTGTRTYDNQNPDDSIFVEESAIEAEPYKDNSYLEAGQMSGEVIEPSVVSGQAGTQAGAYVK